MELKEQLSCLIDHSMMQGNEHQKQMLKNQVVKAVCRLQKVDAAYVAEMLAVLDSMNWRNYLTEHEAKTIISQMSPKPAWPTYEVWKNRMDDADYEYSEKDLYNCYALFVVMNMIYSDSVKSICLVAGRKLEDIAEEEMFGYVYSFALDKLKDEDQKFNVRYYFHLDDLAI